MSVANHNEFAVARYLCGRTLDNGFSGDGKVTLYDSGHSLDDFGYAMTQLTDGSVLVGGQSGGDLALGKFDASGNAVTAFGGDGIVTVDLGGTEQIRGLIAQSDGSIVVGGLKGNDFAIAKITSAGILDSTFGTSSGYTTTDFASGTDAAYALSRQADGKFVIAGVAGSGFLPPRWGFSADSFQIPHG